MIRRFLVASFPAALLFCALGVASLSFSVGIPAWAQTLAPAGLPSSPPADGNADQAVPLNAPAGMVQQEKAAPGTPTPDRTTPAKPAAPAGPAAGQPQPLTPKPAAGTTVPAKAAETKPDAAKPEPPKPDAAKPDAAKPEAAKTDTGKTPPSDAAKPEPGKAPTKEAAKPAPRHEPRKLTPAEETCRYSLPALMNAAEHGDALAAFRVGTIYDIGCGVRASQQTAAAYYEMAAKHGSVEGAVHLAMIYIQGEALGQDYAKARALLDRPAKIGNPLANFYMGVMAYRGDDHRPAKPDVPLAMKYFKVSADTGYAQAQFIVGQAYADGRDLPKDPAAAKEYLTRAADQGHAWAQAILGRLLAERLVPGADPVEALKWLTIARRDNPDDSLLQADTDAALKKLDGHITPAQQKLAQERVKAFAPKLEWDERL